MRVGFAAIGRGECDQKARFSLLGCAGVVGIEAGQTKQERGRPNALEFLNVNSAVQFHRRKWRQQRDKVVEHLQVHGFHGKEEACG